MVIQAIFSPYTHVWPAFNSIVNSKAIDFSNVKMDIEICTADSSGI